MTSRGAFDGDIMLIMIDYVFSPIILLIRLLDLTSIKETVNKFDYLVTTEKDMVKLFKFKIGPVPLRALRIELKIWEESEFYGRVMKLFSNQKVL